MSAELASEKIDSLNNNLAQIGELKEQDAAAPGFYDERAGGIVEIIIEIINKSKQSQ